MKGYDCLYRLRRLEVDIERKMPVYSCRLFKGKHATTLTIFLLEGNPATQRLDSHTCVYEDRQTDRGVCNMQK